MATTKAAWGIEVGAAAIKAIRLERSGHDVSVSDFAYIPHKRVLSTPDLDQDEVVRLSLGQFISQKTLEGEHLVMSVPGHSAFARFAKLPPVDPKKVPDIVKFEAVQQIPFPIDDVEWDYQTFTSKESPEVEVGIFAITRDRVQQRLGLYAELGVSPEALTLSPVSVYNAMAYDLGDRLKGPIVYLDIGTNATDVIVAEAGRCWIRTFPLGGTHFTEAISNAFKLSYSKAEKLKLEAADSKYAKQIMQAMRPVFSDLLQDLQRSIGYYNSLHRESQLTTMVGLGSTFKIPGLRKFLGQQLQIDVVRLNEYKRIAVKGREAAAFAEHAVNLATAYGLALQGVGLAQISVNLVPVKALRDQVWHTKTKWFAAAAVIVIIGAGMMLFRPLVDRSTMAPTPPAVVADVVNTGNQLKQKFEALKSESDIGAMSANLVDLFDDRRVWPYLLYDVSAALASTSPQPELLGDDPDAIMKIDPKQRRLVQLQDLSGEYIPPAGEQSARRIAVTMNVELSHDYPHEFLRDTVVKWLRDHAEPTGERAEVPYRIVDATISTNPTRLVEVSIGSEGQETAVARADSPGTRGGPATPGRSSSSGGLVAGPGGGMGSLRTPTGQTEVAPGSGMDAGAVGSGGRSSTPARTTPRRDGSQSRSLTLPGTPSGDSTSSRAARDVDQLAPVPARPQLYPPNSKYFRVPVTFEIEILDAPAAEAVASTSP